jgi:hypothetical protein
VVPYSLSSVDGNVTLGYDLSVEKELLGLQDTLLLGKRCEE